MLGLSFKPSLCGWAQLFYEKEILGLLPAQSNMVGLGLSPAHISRLRPQAKKPAWLGSAHPNLKSMFGTPDFYQRKNTFLCSEGMFAKHGLEIFFVPLIFS